MNIPFLIILQAGNSPLSLTQVEKLTPGFRWLSTLAKILLFIKVVQRHSRTSFMFLAARHIMVVTSDKSAKFRDVGSRELERSILIILGV